MPANSQVFLDASALFAAVWSSEGGARMFLKLGEAGAVRLMVSSQVLDEVEGALRRKAPEALGAFALLLDRSNIEVTSLPTNEAIRECLVVTGYQGDAGVLAAALNSQVDYFVTLDRQHFLDNPRLSGFAPFPIGTPGDFLAWFRARWGEARV
jgi:predicted nucleic acid-binding protein